MDTLTRAERSRVMSRVRAKDTRPEMAVRRLLHGLGYRYRVHVKALAGSPDLVFPSRRRVILIHGCFWHRHKCPMGNRMPKSRLKFWRRKLEANRTRDERTLRKLRYADWRVLVVWECQVHNLEKLATRLRSFLS